MPRVVEGDQGRHTTAFAPPDWVPSEPGPGILLIDNVNRADDRILRDIMQLLQNYELVSWKLPPDWHIVLTANPDGGDYYVTPMDDAMVTRMLHVGLEFDVKASKDFTCLRPSMPILPKTMRTSHPPTPRTCSTGRS